MQLALFMFVLIGVLSFAKAACVKAGVTLPRGPGDDWVTIAGYVNTKEPDTIQLSKEELLDLAVFGVPLVFGGLFLAFGRLTGGAAPGSSGAKGLFAFSGLFTFIALACLVTAISCEKLNFKETLVYVSHGFLISFAAAELLFLSGLATAGVALKRSGAAKAVGLLIVFAALVAALATIGKSIYDSNYRPKPVNPDIVMYERAAVMVGCMLVVGLYWRAVRSVRSAIGEFLDRTEM